MPEVKQTYDRRKNGERRSMEERGKTDGRRESDICPLQALHIEKLANLEARMEAQEDRCDSISRKLEVIDRIDKNLEVITKLFENQQLVNAKQEKTNERLEEAIEKVADAVTQTKLDGSVSFNQILKPLIFFLVSGGAIYAIYQIANGLLK